MLILLIGFSVSVCACVYMLATEPTFWSRNLILVLNDPWDMRKKHFFLFFEIFFFTLFIGIFRFFPYITLVKFWFQATGHSFSPRNVIFGLREPCTIRNEGFWNFLKIQFFTVNWVIFSIFGNITLVILEISKACDLSF